jgi:dihydroorotate dehydrogenase (fumarate)
MNLQTDYLGLRLEHPFILGASPLAATLDRVRQAEDGGAAAIVIHSLFEEQITRHERGMEAHVLSHQESFAEATSYFPWAIDYHFGPDKYLEHLRAVKAAVSIPVMASLNGTRLGGWADFSAMIGETGVDALELNLYHQPRDTEETAEMVEKRMLQGVEAVRQATDIPITVKLSPFFSSLPHFVYELEQRGVAGVVIFNRFYQPDIDIDNLETVPRLVLSDSRELLLRLRWLAVLFGRYKMSLAVTGGVHTRDDAIKAIMAGADCIQMVSAPLQQGVSHFGKMRDALASWLVEKEYESLKQMKGSMSYLYAPNPEAIERANYLRILQSWEP